MVSRPRWRFIRAVGPMPAAARSRPGRCGRGLPCPLGGHGGARRPVSPGQGRERGRGRGKGKGKRHGLREPRHPVAGAGRGPGAGSALDVRSRTRIMPGSSWRAERDLGVEAMKVVHRGRGCEVDTDAIRAEMRGARRASQMCRRARSASAPSPSVHGSVAKGTSSSASLIASSRCVASPAATTGARTISSLASSARPSALGSNRHEADA